jgi:hypothetical protein
MSIELLPRFLLRGAGFPARMLDGLATPRTAELATALAEAKERRADQARLLRDELQGRPGAVRAVRGQIRRRLASGRPIDGDGPLAPRLIRAWNHVVAEVDALAAEADTTAACEEEQTVSHLRELVAHPEVREAIWLSSPSAHDRLARPDWPRSAGRRRLAVLYVQRLAAKNDTTAFFGPFSLGCVHPGSPDAPVLSYRAGTARTGRRYAFLARHVIDALAGCIEADPGVLAHLGLEPHPLLRLEDGAVSLASSPLRLPDGLIQAMIRLRGRLRGDWDVALGAGTVDGLLRRRVLVSDLPPPTTDLDEAARLRSRLEAIGEPAAPWLVVLDRLDGQVAAASATPWPHRRDAYAAVERTLSETGVAARMTERPGGTLNADRAVLFEEAEGDLADLVLDAGQFIGRCGGLETALRVHAAYAAAVREDVRQRVVAAWEACSLPHEVPLGTLLSALEEPLGGFRAEGGWSPAAEALWRRVGALAPESASRVELVGAEVERELAGSMPAEPFLCSPDLLLAAPEGPPLTPERVVPILAEVHHGAQVWCWLQRAVDPSQRRAVEERLTAWADRLARGGAALATMVEPRMTGKTFTLELPGLAIERLGRSALPRERVRSLWEVRARREGDVLSLWDGGRPVVLAPTSPVDPIVRAFGGLVLWGPRSLPFRRHQPRVLVDGMVWFREAWRLDSEQRARLARAERGAPAMEAVAELRTREALPRHVFARIPEEPKPVGVDLASLPFAELLCWLARRGSDLVLTETLPSPDHLALRLPQGDFTSELRLSVLVDER